MRRFLISLVLATGISVAAQANEAEDYKLFFLASYQPVPECQGEVSSPELKSGCYTVPPAPTRFAGSKEHPATIAWGLSKEAQNGRIFGDLPAPLRVKAVADVKPVYKHQARHLASVKKQCTNCVFVSAETQMGRRIARQVGVQASSVVGFFVPFPASLLVNTLTCAGVSTAFDAKEYREDYREEPTQEQYQKAFGSNALYCSPVGGMIAASESKNPLMFAGALLGFSGYFANIPAPVMYGSSALQMVGGYATPGGAGKPVASHKPQVAAKHLGKVRRATAKPATPKVNTLAASQP